MQFFKGNHHLFSMMEALEDRVLFDGVPDATFVFPIVDAGNPTVPADIQRMDQADLSGPRELVLVDAGVEGSQQLLASIIESKADSILEIRMLDSNQDGISQISQILANTEGEYDAIHVISHGSEGRIQLGSSWLSNDNISGYTNEIAGWSGALKQDADLLFYGCNLGVTKMELRSSKRSAR